MQCSDTSITLDVDRGTKKRMADFLSGQAGSQRERKIPCCMQS